MTNTHYRGIVRAAVVALALVLVPTVAFAQSRRGGGGGSGNLEFGGEFGLAIPFDSGPNIGFKLAPELIYMFPEFTPSVAFGVGGQLAFSLHPFGDFSSTWWFMDIVPIGRVLFAVTPKVGIYGDLGMGIGLVHASVAGFSTTDTAFLLKFGGGAQIKLDQKLSFTAGPAFNFYVKSGSATVFTIMGGLLYKI
jgi:hypothetical protein